MSLVNWFVALVHRLKPATWSMEEVPHAQLAGALSMARQFHPEMIDFVPTLTMSDYGVPQHRISQRGRDLLQRGGVCARKHAPLNG